MVVYADQGEPSLPSLAAGGDIGSQFVKTAYTFRRFTHNYLYLLSLQNSFKGPDGKLALDVTARSFAYLALALGGIPALPFLDDLLDLWERFLGDPVRSLFNLHSDHVKVVNSEN